MLRRKPVAEREGAGPGLASGLARSCGGGCRASRRCSRPVQEQDDVGGVRARRCRPLAGTPLASTTSTLTSGGRAYCSPRHRGACVSRRGLPDGGGRRAGRGRRQFPGLPRQSSSGEQRCCRNRGLALVDVRPADRARIAGAQHDLTASSADGAAVLAVTRPALAQTEAAYFDGFALDHGVSSAAPRWP
jgi:hypothetical protein